MVAIKGMEMPKSCWKCNFCLNKDGYYCAISSELLADEAVDIPDESRPSDCPLTEIVTCKDCKNWLKGVNTQMSDYKEYNFCPMVDFNTSEDFYCAAGERKE